MLNFWKFLFSVYSQKFLLHHLMDDVSHFSYSVQNWFRRRKRNSTGAYWQPSHLHRTDAHWKFHLEFHPPSMMLSRELWMWDEIRACQLKPSDLRKRQNKTPKLATIGRPDSNFCGCVGGLLLGTRQPSDLEETGKSTQLQPPTEMSKWNHIKRTKHRTITRPEWVWI